MAIGSWAGHALFGRHVSKTFSRQDDRKVTMQESTINQKEGNGNIHMVFAHSEQVCEFTSEYISSCDLARPESGDLILEESTEIETKH